MQQVAILITMVMVVLIWKITEVTQRVGPRRGLGPSRADSGPKVGSDMIFARVASRPGTRRDEMRCITVEGEVRGGGAELAFRWGCKSGVPGLHVGF